MQRSSNELQLTAVDLFAGGGGLTVGLKRAGFIVVGAVEIESNALSTYKANHPEVQVFKQDVRTISGQSLKRLSSTGRIDLLAGCPPCQGYSSLTYKYKRFDPRNELITEMGRLVQEIKPRAVMMENVPGLGTRGEELFLEFINLLYSLDYYPDIGVLQVADFGVPQSRRRLVVLAGRGLPIKLPLPTHSKKATDDLLPWKTVEEIIRNIETPIILKDSASKGGPQAFNWNVVRSLSPENQRRLNFAKPGKGWTSIPKRLRPRCHKNRKAGFPNVYGRMSWDQPSPTITGGCTTLSKGRFGHPEEDRTISVREAALLQTFPKDYIIDTPYMEHACNIIGNALPCDFAEVLARQCATALAGSKD